MEITANMVKELREITGAGVLDCKKMLVETEGNLEDAAAKLRERGMAQAAKKVGREANEGLIGHYVHPGSRVAALIEVNCETDFVARTPEFQELVHDLAMQVVGSRPQYVRVEDVPPAVVECQKAEYRSEVEGQGKPENVLNRIVEGKMNKFYQEACLVEQPFIKDEAKMVGELVTEMIAKLGENIIIRRFVRYELGEELGE